MTPPTLLLAEDSTADAALIVRSLAPVVAPEQVVVRADGLAALDYLFGRGTEAPPAGGELPRAILLDLNLPRLPGLDVLREVRASERTRLIPVIILSASMDPEEVRTAIRLGANSFVRKSPDFDTLTNNLQQVARYWLELNVPPSPEERRRP